MLIAISHRCLAAVALCLLTTPRHQAWLDDQEDGPPRDLPRRELHQPAATTVDAWLA
jgi:hypothetical protein